MTTTLDAAKKRPTLDQILKAAPMLCRASIDLDPAAGTQPGTLSATLPDGTTLTDEMIDGLLERCRLGQRVEIDVRMLAYEQWDFEKFPGKDNRNYVCFRAGEMRSLGSTGKRKPFLRDHEQGESLARGGTLIESKTEEPEDGHHQIFQKVRLSAPWAVEMYLRGLMTTVSIGWIPTGPVLCSACNAPVFEKCGGWFGHWPGDRLKEIVDTETGEKRLVRSSKGTILVRWIYTAAELTETSCVPVPGVPTAEMDQLRATLSAQFPALANGDDSDEESPSFAEALGKSTLVNAANNVSPQPESTQMADQPDQTQKLASARKALFAALTMPDEHRAHAARLAAANDLDGAEAFCGESATVREAAVKSALDADPVVFTGEVTKRVVRRSHGELAKQLAEDNEAAARKLAAQEMDLDRARAASEENEVSAICARIPHLPGSDPVHRNIVRALRKSGDPTLLEDSLKALAGASNFVQAAGRAPGVNDGVDPGNGTALEAFEAALAAFAKSKGLAPDKATEDFLATKQGADLYDAYDKSRRAAR